MEFRKILTLRGPNVWAKFPVLEAWVDLGVLKDSPSDELPGFNDRIMAWLPTMIEHRCSVGTRGGFFERLRRGTYQAHILEHVTLELQSLAGTEVGYGRARETSEEGVYKVAIEYEDEVFAKACLHAARELCLAAVHDRPYDVDAEVARLRALNEEVRLGPSTRAIVDAAVARGIPVRRLNSDSLVQLGWGARQRRINTAETDRTGAVAEAIAQDKDLTRELLRQVGVPVADGRPVKDAEDAWTAATEIGGPVVVKPRFGNHGRGVTTNLATREEVLTAYRNALEQSSEIVVERYAPGDDYRLLVVGGRLVAAARRDPAHVVGDGTRSIAELVEQVNRDPRRGDGHGSVLTRIRLDSIALETLASQDLDADSVPEPGRVVVIRRNANLSTGGTATDVTDEVHPEVAARAIDAAQVVGLDIAGIDVVARDVRRPLEEQGGIVVEVNAGPGLRMHLQPSAGTPRPVGEAIVDMMFPAGENGRIPIVSVTGVNGKTTVTRLVSHILRTSGKVVGLTCTDGIEINGRLIDQGDCAGPKSARALLVNPRVEAAALETARGGILREGLGFDQCDVGIVTNIGEGDHLGMSEIATLEKLAQVKRAVIEAVAATGTGVLKADDPLTAAMAEYCPGSVTFFARDEADPVLSQHRAQGGSAVFVRDGLIVHAVGNEETGIAMIDQIPLTVQGRIGFQVENVLAAVAAARALGITLPTLREALATFSSDVGTTPGRFNVFHHAGATVIVDYGHNPSALLAMGEAMAQLPHERRKTVFTVAGDRRDVDIVRQGQIVGDLFDEIILYEDACRRGRADGEVTALIREGLTQAVRFREVHETRGELNAVEYALSQLKAGDLLVIQADQVELCLAFVRKFLQDSANRPVTRELVNASVPVEAVAVSMIE
ncbi:MAG: cyanophycin synthetase [Isosphaeraceae bacterium]